MKQMIAILAFSILGIGSTFAGGNPEISKEINQKMIVDLSDVELDESHPNYVIVRFNVVNGQIKINHINGTGTELESIVREKLNSITLEERSNIGDEYAYKFTFEKE